MILVEVMGWVAALLILLAYILLTLGHLKAQSVSYQAMNVGGAFGLLINGWVNRAYPSAALNLVWLGIGAYALWTICRRD